jgi:SAM-dependent methyltransferase
MSIPYLSYYKKINILPTINIEDLKQNIIDQQRFNFYFKLGISLNDFQDKSVLEIGPGTGYNANYLLRKTKIKNIHLIDKDLNSIKFLKKNLKGFRNVKIYNKNINKFKIKKKFDYVIIENVIYGLSNPHKIFKKISDMTAKNGIIVLTLCDKIGIFSEKLRYLYSLMIFSRKKINTFDQKLFFLEKIFKKHLNYLNKNTRSSKKWVLDNILHEEWIRKEKYFDYFDLYKLLKKQECIIKSFSPSFFLDYLWYKIYKIKNRNYEILKQYKTERVNFFDFETILNKQNVIDIKLFNFYIERIQKNINSFSFDKKISINKIIVVKNDLNKIIGVLKFKNKKEKLYLALREYISFINQFLLKKKINLNSKHFYKFWGQGTIQVSILKN